MTLRRTRTQAAVRFLAVGALALTGCPAKDRQELKPLAALAREEAEGAAAEKSAPEAAAHAEGAEPGERAVAGEAPEVDEGGTAQGWVSYSTGAAGPRGPTAGRRGSTDMTFGPGSSGPAEHGAWTYNVDTTGAVGDILGVGVTYGAASGELQVVPGVPATREDAYSRGSSKAARR